MVVCQYLAALKSGASHGTGAPGVALFVSSESTRVIDVPKKYICMICTQTKVPLDSIQNCNIEQLGNKNEANERLTWRK